LAVTLTTATTKAEKKNKDTSGERIRRDILYPKVRVVGGSRRNVAWHSIAPF